MACERLVLEYYRTIMCILSYNLIKTLKYSIARPKFPISATILVKNAQDTLREYLDSLRELDVVAMIH